MMGESWNRFWARSRGGRFTRESWSKKRILERLDRILRPGLRVLDAGCGSGFFSLRFIERGCLVTALDLSEEALALAREATGGRAESYLCEDLLDPGFAERRARSFDLVFSDGLLEHYAPRGQEGILANFRAILARGGSVATFVPNALSGWTLIRPLFMPGIREVPLRPARLRELHRDFEIVDAGGLNVLPFRFSPERLLGARFGMLLYVIARGKGEGA
ncbi:MAG: class I SAM-dependent methyltransferase [Candidatus Eisenbacteria bacterium]